MSEAKAGDSVSIHYTGKLDDGTEFDSSAGQDPLKFELGSGQVIAGFDKAVEGMNIGDNKNVRIEAGDAYGERHEQLVQTVPRTALPAEIEPSVGMPLQSRSEDGQVINVTITEVSDESITVDANHPLAGMALNFDIELVAID
jgi:peptidylprolyl isomerase